MFKNLLSLEQQWQNRLTLPKQEHLLLLESLFQNQPMALQCSTLPDHVILIFKIVILNERAGLLLSPFLSLEAETEQDWGKSYNDI